MKRALSFVAQGTRAQIQASEQHWDTSRAERNLISGVWKKCLKH